LYYSGGVEIDGVSKKTQLEQTNTALRQDDVIIYEAGIIVGINSLG
jgi:hypothetical protein|tara:strand:- start:1087 stop:1224 length:138 start_codon:yes stop_codon:yes gene_type:complete